MNRLTAFFKGEIFRKTVSEALEKKKILLSAGYDAMLSGSSLPALWWNLLLLSSG